VINATQDSSPVRDTCVDLKISSRDNFMNSSEQVAQPSPWSSVWQKPADTIERILAERPRRGVLLLGSVGLMSGSVSQLLGFGIQNQVFDWRIVVALAVACAIGGIASLYIAAFVLKYCGRMLGGRASAADLRTVVAWGMTPGILGLVVAVALAVVASVASRAGEPAPAWIFSLLQTTILTCGIWSVTGFAKMLARVEGFGFWRTATACILGWILTLALSLLIAAGIRTVLFQPFSIPSHAMNPTLLVGDNLFVSKFSYGYTHYSIPLSPQWFSGRIFGAEPARGDVVVFRIPKDDSVDYIKRVVGLPGDRIQVKQGMLTINGTAVKREPMADFVGDGSCGENAAAAAKRWRETLPNGVSYETLDCVENGLYDNTRIFEVPAGQFFALGDNRDNSTDSRLATFGTIPFDNLVGRARMIFLSVAPASGDAPSVARPERVGQMIH
jgi:signal peptidase I